MTVPRMLIQTTAVSISEHNNRMTTSPAAYPRTLVTHISCFASKGTTARDMVSMKNLHNIRNRNTNHQQISSEIFGSSLEPDICW